MDLFYLGKVNGTHHLKGTIKVYSVFDNPDKLINNKVIVEKQDEQKRVLTVMDSQILNQKIILMTFKEITNKSEAMKIMGSKVYIRRDILGEINKEEYYADDLMDMEVLTLEGENLGKITDIMETAAHDILIINEDEDEIMIPSVEEFVKEINFEERKVLVDIPEGLKNLNKKGE